MKDQNLGRCNAVDRDEMGRDQNDNGVFWKIQLKCKTSKKGLLLAEVIDFEFFGRQTIQESCWDYSESADEELSNVYIAIYGSNIRNVAEYRR